jgi:DNA modification methylase
MINAEQMFLFDNEITEDTSEVETRQAPQRVQYGDLWQLGKHRLLCSDATKPENVTSLLQNEQYDLCFADPPYGIGIDDWDKPLEDTPALITLISSHLKQGGFFAFTHQMPRCLEWLNVLDVSGLRFKDHVVWVKRNGTGIALQLLRGHESLFIYGKGKNKYYTTKGLYTDVKLPGLLVDVASLEGIDRYIKDLQQKVAGTASPRQVSHQSHKSYSYMPSSTDRSPMEANFTNVWSFLPEHQSRRNRHIGNHATVKPVLLLQRLITLCTAEDTLIYDPFLGSGTTIIASQVVGKRRVYGCEISPENCDTILHRFETTTGQHATLIHRIEQEQEAV